MGISHSFKGPASAGPFSLGWSGTALPPKSSPAEAGLESEVSMNGAAGPPLQSAPERRPPELIADITGPGYSSTMRDAAMRWRGVDD